MIYSNSVTCSLLFIGFVNSYYYEEESRPTYLTAAVGEHAVLNCDLNFPQGIRIPYVLNWNKEVSKKFVGKLFPEKFVRVGNHGIFVVQWGTDRCGPLCGSNTFIE